MSEDEETEEIVPQDEATRQLSEDLKVALQIMRTFRKKGPPILNKVIKVLNRTLDLVEGKRKLEVQIVLRTRKKPDVIDVDKKESP